MAGPWIKVCTGYFPIDGRLLAVSRQCHASPVTAFGGLVALWCLGDGQADAEGCLFGYTAADVNAYVGIPGFCEALPDCWIDLSGQWVKLPKYQEHNGSTGKTRAQAFSRQRRHRDVTAESRIKRDASATREKKEKEKEQKSPPAPRRGESRPRAKATRIPNGWYPDEADIAFAREYHPSDAEIGEQAARFRDYFAAAPGQKGLKVDWHATWRNWIRPNTSNLTRPVAAYGTRGTPYEDLHRGRKQSTVERVHQLNDREERSTLDGQIIDVDSHWIE